MEHPAEPTWRPEAPSSWQLPELRALAAHPEAKLCYVDQCMFGAPSQKPTGLMAVQCPQLLALLQVHRNAGRCNGGHLHVNLMQRLPDGRFGTAPSKQYPAGLCAVLARALATNVAERLPPSRGEAEPDPVAERLFVPLDPFWERHVEGAFAPDCAR